ncbi:MAG TPA: molybdenum ABC transporter ATP-binding protein [Thermoanaerobaculia bacterium]|nr:molybdenum ABC transporter ATP-binding protein [Thermoanaerobaculia bacterium]
MGSTAHRAGEAVATAGTGAGPGLVARLELTLGTLRLDAELTAPAPGVTALFGPSGAGKTTLLRALAGLERAAGVVEVAGRRWQDTAAGVFLPTHRRPLGYVAQEAALFAHRTVRGNLRYALERTPAGRRRLDVEEAARRVGLEGLLERRPEGLSGGERQRVALARALLRSPDLLLLDEPLAALDAAAKAEILPYLERLGRELAMPVLYVTHSRDEVLRIADRLVLLDAGRIQAAGPLADLATRLDPAAWATGDEDVGTVAEAVVVGHDDAEGLTLLEVGSLPLRLPRADLPAGRRLRVRFLARDISLVLEPPRATSILNVLPARVLEVRSPETPQPLILLEVTDGEGAATGLKLLSRITRHSVDRLDLAPRKRVYAQVKAVALVR